MIIHVVQSGDSLWRIAQRYNVSLQSLIFANGLSNPDVLVVGQAIVVPTGPGQSPVYQVMPGDTLWKIAQQYGTTVAALVQENNIANPNQIYPGQILSIPRPTIKVNGYLTAMGSRGQQILYDVGDFLTYVTPFSYRVRADGQLTPLNDTAVLSAARDKNIIPLMVLTNFADVGGFDSDLSRAAFQNQDVLIGNVLRIMQEKGYQGVNVDFEYVYQEDREAYNQFIRNLAQQLHARGYSLSTALAPKISAEQIGLLYEAHDYPVHGQYNDFVILMTYEYGWSGGPPWAISPVTELRRVLDYATRLIPREKILLGLPTYGRDWRLPYMPGGPRARTITNAEALRLAAIHGAAISYHPEYQAPYFRYRDSQGREHEVWFEDARSLQAKLNLVKEYGLGGISFWELTLPFPESWAVLAHNFRIQKP